jgi:hypothetical protein
VLNPFVRLIIPIPIQRINVPENHTIAKLRYDAIDHGVVKTKWRSEDFFASDIFSDDVVRALYFFSDFNLRHPGEIRVRVRVVADPMTSIKYLLNQTLQSLSILANYEKRCADIELAQRLQQMLGYGWMRAIIKCKPYVSASGDGIPRYHE